MPTGCDAGSVPEHCSAAPRAGGARSRALLMGIIGSPRCPDALLVELDDGRRATTSPPLTTAQALEVATAVAEALRPLTAGEHSLVHWLLEPLPQVKVETTADGSVCFSGMASPG